MEQPTASGRRVVWPWLLATLALAGLARLPAFALPHLRGDEPVYLALAATWREAGFESFNLRHRDLLSAPLLSEGGRLLALRTVVRGEARRGTIVRYYAAGGEDYHDRAVSTYGPLQPILIALCQGAFGPETFTVLGVRPEVEAQARAAGEGARIRSLAYRTALAGAFPEADEVARGQVFVVLPSLLASLLTLAATFFLTLRIGGDPAVAALSALFVTTAPAELLAAHVAQADALATALAAVALVLAHRSLLSRGPRASGLALAAGLAIGAGILAKPQVAVVGAACFACDAALAWRQGELRSRSAPLLGFAAGAALLSLPWILWVGGALAPELDPGHAARGPFGQWVRGRPWWIYPFNLLHYAPLLLLGVALIRRPRARVRPGVLLAALVIAALAVATWLYPGRENRYLLPAYPALAALAALGCRRLLTLTSARFGAPVGRALLAAPILWLLLRSLSLGALAAREGLTHWSAESLYGL